MDLYFLQKNVCRGFCSCLFSPFDSDWSCCRCGNPGSEKYVECMNLPSMYSQLLSMIFDWPHSFALDLLQSFGAGSRQFLSYKTMRLVFSEQVIHTW